MFVAMSMFVLLYLITCQLDPRSTYMCCPMYSTLNAKNLHPWCMVIPIPTPRRYAHNIHEKRQPAAVHTKILTKMGPEPPRTL